jgi:elongation factor P--(R)-beta-lysine ligase
MAWQPSCSFELLRLRAQLLQKIRQFFSDRNVLEVETPLLGSAIGTDPNLDFFTADYLLPHRKQTLYLQTSPEFAMKRLLAMGSGSIFQICKAFRNGESGRFHNPEFTLLEWYRVGYDLAQLMAEVEGLITTLFAERALQPAQRISYQDLFQQTTGLNPLAFHYEDYVSYAQNNGLVDAATLCGQDHASWLDFIFSQHIQPSLAHNTLWLVYGYPTCLPSLARLNWENPRTVDRVELFINGVELGNGYHELCDAKEQARRFDKEIAIRQTSQRPSVSKDERFMAALEAGLPDCSGIAIGLDRILMLLSNSATIDEVLAFSISRA